MKTKRKPRVEHVTPERFFVDDESRDNSPKSGAVKCLARILVDIYLKEQAETEAATKSTNV